MKEDLSLKQHVLDELAYEPGIDAENIGVTVEEGIVRLTGCVPRFYQKSRAEEAVLRVSGVRGVVQRMEVRQNDPCELEDEEIAHRAVEYLRWRVQVPAEFIQVKVQNGWVLLRGSVEWNYQRIAAAEFVTGIAGVRGLINEIKIKPGVAEYDVRECIEKALQRYADVDADNITVDVQGGIVTLLGTVRHWQERSIVRQAAWSARGVTEVYDELALA